MKNKTTLIGAILITALLLTGAVIAKNNGYNNGNKYGHDNPNNPHNNDDEFEEACETSEDCPEGMVCEDGECVEIECETDEDCNEDEICAEGLCVEEEDEDDGEDSNGGNGQGQNNANGPNGPNPNGPNGPNDNGPNNEGTPNGRPFQDIWDKIEELEERLERCGCIACTDDDGDSYAVEGEVCGPIDCDDTDPEINPGATETCDGVDNDCDGQVDGMTRACYSGSPETQGVGECQDGTETCEAGSWGSCIGEVIPTTEVCDGLDNDCDEETDEDVICDDNNVCTLDACTGEACVYTITPGVTCDDGLICTIDDQCSVTGECVGTPIICDDGNECTADSCVEPSGCVNDPLTGTPCGIGGTCNEGVCEIPD